MYFSRTLNKWVTQKPVITSKKKKSRKVEFTGKELGWWNWVEK